MGLDGRRQTALQQHFGKHEQECAQDTLANELGCHSRTPSKRSRGIPEGRATRTIVSDLELRIWTRVKGGTAATRGRRQQNKDMKSKEHQCDALVLFRHQVTPPSPHRQDTQPPLLSRVSASPPLPSSTVLFLRIENSNSHQLSRARAEAF